MTKRYAIVRVDNKCLSDYENIKCPYDYKCAKCKFGKLENYNYGDTKEQMIKKVATAIFRREVKAYKKFWDIEPSRVVSADMYALCLKVAKEVVEFLGVEE